MKTVGYAAHSASTPLSPFNFERRELRPHDVLIEILYCGICHSDLHVARNEWQGTTYPVVPGHEIVGRVTKIGSDVKTLKEGDFVGVGCIVDCCRTCISSQVEEMQKHANSLDFILDTVAFEHDLNSYLSLLKQEGTMCLVGLPSKPYSILKADCLITKRRELAGSLIGGIEETQELLNFCADHNVHALIELITIDKVNEAFERMLKGDVKYRFVIDIASWSDK